ncbi:MULTISPECIES: hypothetical protein [Streptomyces]|uniref:Nucleoside diphosphate kinase n=1 Tax=Streptomyces koelreuteriae TaxID=2838015 RepID=A0ABX8FP67_9ACTN|nr:MULTISPECIES: hypothetical protein [Streptomyces]QWB22958.1 hypothetical protein KJK29_10350 [Streptomyces koelreuteriae]UUA05906.1 hypothetical protein NNW98_10405 [Streptomyces koelreuteriae]UUA13534.1 hypothetical protein NNW99_10405 [Streptomyces sp. CRCS-T-1]
MSAGALLILKPDILAGPYARCPAAAARDAVRGLLRVYEPATAQAFEVDTSAQAVAWALANIERKVRARDWYVRTLHAPGPRLAALRNLLSGPVLAPREDGSVRTSDLVLGIADAFGFTVADRRRTRCTQRDFLGLYADNTHFTRLAGSLRGYLVDQEVELYRYAGEEELSTLHIAKEMVRRVVRYPTTHYDAVENLLHVSDPGARDWTYFLNTAFTQRDTAA